MKLDTKSFHDIPDRSARTDFFRAVLGQSLTGAELIRVTPTGAHLLAIAALKGEDLSANDRLYTQARADRAQARAELAECQKIADYAADDAEANRFQRNVLAAVCTGLAVPYIIAAIWILS